MSDQLTPLESSQLEKLEAIITKGKESFVDVGRAIMEIREGRLYRRDYSTFEGYCQGKWGWGVKRAQQLVRASAFWEGQKRLADAGHSVALPKTEGGARKMMQVSANEQRDTSVSLPSATKVSKPETVVDSEGHKVPAGCVEIWNRRQELQDLMTQVSRMKSLVETGRANKDPLFMPIQNFISTQFDALHYSLMLAKPYAVCTACQGHPVEAKCTFCFGTGLIGKKAYEDQTAIELKSVRHNSNRRA